MTATINFNAEAIAEAVKEVITPLQNEIRELKAELQKLKSPIEEETLTVKDLMKLLKVSEPTIYALIKEGRLPEPIKYGRKNVWHLEDIKEFINKR